MTLDEFWSLIESSGRGDEDCDDQSDRLTGMLAKLSPGEIEAFDLLLWDRIGEAYRWDLWGVAYIMNGGCSDDGFLYFRGWLISKGRAFYEAALDSAENAARGISDGGSFECESILSSPNYAYESLTGRDVPPTPGNNRRFPVGEPWEEEDLERLYPELWNRFK